ncbi:hypothetical protein [Acidaminobacterium chupaoyuni]
MRKNEFDTEFSQELLPRQMQTPLSGRHTERFEKTTSKSEKTEENKRHDSKTEASGR